MSEIRIGLVGLGKVTVDEHIPAIEKDHAFTLVGGVSPRSRLPGVDAYPDLDSMLRRADVDAVAINTPPQVRFALARQALGAGKHVMLEKPPCATVTELAVLERIASEAGVTLYTGWHSQHAAAVPLAREWLESRQVRRVEVTWRENVRQWHPGQRWLWQPGGLGVFDCGINALSILTAILPQELVLERAQFRVPGNCQTPIAASLLGRVGEQGTFAARLDFLYDSTPNWLIAIETDRGTLETTVRGGALAIDGVAQDIGPYREYPLMYRRFADLVETGQSEVDGAPLALTADAFLLAEQVHVEAFTG